MRSSDSFCSPSAALRFAFAIACPLFVANACASQNDKGAEGTGGVGSVDASATSGSGGSGAGPSAGSGGAGGWSSTGGTGATAAGSGGTSNGGHVGGGGDPGGGSAGNGGARAATGGASGARGTGGAAGALALPGICHASQTHTHNLNNDNWAGSLSLFISYSADTRSQTVDKGYTADAWNAAVNSFDVPGFATQVAATGAKNILLMLGQNTGYYNSPNSVYETYAGVAPNTRCSKRDLPMEIADALATKGIGMFLYLPEDVGWGDTKAANSFGLSAQAVSNWVVDASFTPKWNAVIKTWADRYGSKVRGWFFDGYEARWGVTAAMANTYSATCKASNPCAVVTFNGAGSDSVSDTERGETRIDATTGFPAKGLPTSRWNKNDQQVSWAFPLQAAWGQEIADNSPAIYITANLKTFITAGIKAQAVFTLDVRTSLAGTLSVPIYTQLLAIKQ